MSRIARSISIRGALVAAVVWTLFGAGMMHAQQTISGPSKVAVIDVRRILTESNAGREALEALRLLAEGESANLDTLEAEITALQARLDEGAFSLSQEKQEELLAEIQEKKIAMRRAQDDARLKMEEGQATRFGAIEDRVMPLIAKIGEEQGFTLIFNKFEDSGLLWAQDGADITDLVLERFNALPES